MVNKITRIQAIEISRLGAFNLWLPLLAFLMCAGGGPSLILWWMSTTGSASSPGSSTAASAAAVSTRWVQCLHQAHRQQLLPQLYLPGGFRVFTRLIDSSFCRSCIYQVGSVSSPGSSTAASAAAVSTRWVPRPHQAHRQQLLPQLYLPGGLSGGSLSHRERRIER
jgi:hypothetical protein